MALPLAVEAALAPDEIRRAPIGPGLWSGPRRQARWVGRGLRVICALALSAWELDCHAVVARTSQVSDWFRLSVSNRQVPLLTLPSGTQRARRSSEADRWATSMRTTGVCNARTSTYVLPGSW